MGLSARWRHPLLIALAIIAVLFGTYEVLERTVLRGVDPQILHYLHMARGMGTSLLVAIVLVVYFMNRLVPGLPLRGVDMAGLEGHEGDAILLQQNRWLVRIRWAMVLVFGAVAVTSAFLVPLVSAEIRMPLVVTAGAFALANTLFDRLVRARVRPARILWAQMAADLVFLSVVLHYTGGIANPIVWFFSLHVVLAGILLEKLPAFAVAILACLLVSGLALLETTGVLRHHSFPLFSTPGAGDLAHDARYASSATGALCLLIALAAVLTTTVRASLRDSERDLLRAYKMAAVGRLSAGVAHEINNPLGIASARVKLLLEEADRTPLDEATLTRLRVVDRQLDRMTAIVRGMLAYARPSSANQHPLDLSRTVRDVVAGVHLKEGATGLRIEQHLSEGPLMIQGDPSQIAQIVVNLLSNALEAMPQGGTARVSTWQEDGEALLRVEDAGIGMSPDVQARIFEPFFTTKSDTGGTGLGLAIVKGFVAAHHGQIAVTSAPGRGTRFDLRFPKAKGGAL